jgi:addiction module HigA family antidote
MKNGMRPIHPGEVLREDILPDTGLTITAAAEALKVSRQMLHDILAERRPLSPLMCFKISRLFGSTPDFWMRLQAAYDLKRIQLDKQAMENVARIRPVKRTEAA